MSAREDILSNIRRSLGVNGREAPRISAVRVFIVERLPRLWFARKAIRKFLPGEDAASALTAGAVRVVFASRASQLSDRARGRIAAAAAAVPHGAAITISATVSKQAGASQLGLAKARLQQVRAGLRQYGHTGPIVRVVATTTVLAGSAARTVTIVAASAALHGLDPGAVAGAASAAEAAVPTP